MVIKKCWNLLDDNGNDVSGVLLSACVPELESLATHSSPYQYDAALLAVEATIMQMIIAIRKLDFVRLVELGEDAVRFGKISGDNRLLVTAMRWHGDSYKNYYHQPKTAIAIYNDALKCGDISLLNKADIYIGLAVAYAQDNAQEDYETEAQKYAELAQMTMPEYPEQDPLFRFIRTGQSEIDQRVGKVYLILAKHFPTKKEYAQMAYEAHWNSTKAILFIVTIIARSYAVCGFLNLQSDNRPLF